MNNWFSRHLDCQDKGFTFSSHPMTCFVLRHHVDGVHTVVHPCCAYIFLFPTHPHLDCLKTPPSTWFQMLPFAHVFTQGTPYLGNLPRSYIFLTGSKKVHLQRTSIHLGSNLSLHCGRPSKIQGDHRKLHIGRHQFFRFRENAHRPKIWTETQRGRSPFKLVGIFLTHSVHSW